MNVKTMFLVAAAFLMLATAVPALYAAEVAQGKCLVYSESEKTIRIEEYDTNISKEVPYGNPTGIISQFDVSKAKVGIYPEQGDILRIAYDIVGDQNVARKVMNVSKQDLRQK